MTTSNDRFLYPHSRQFPFDDIWEQIVRELEARNWQVSGMTVKFGTYGHGYRCLRELSGINFLLLSGRSQGFLAGHQWYDTAAIQELWIPEKGLSVNDDESGPTLYLYAGKSWETDKERFMRSTKIHTKMDRKPKWYLRYKGGMRRPEDLGLQFIYRGHRPTYLVWDDDLGREYAPEGKEPKFFRTSEVMNEFREWIKKHVLAPILATPVPR